MSFGETSFAAVAATYSGPNPPLMPKGPTGSNSTMKSTDGTIVPPTKKELFLAKAKAEALRKSENVARAAFQINSLLYGLSNKEIQEALSMVAVTRNLRVIPIDRPIALAAVPKKEQVAKAEKPKKNVNPPNKGGWNSDPRFKTAIAARNTAVETLKNGPDKGTPENDELVTALRAAEAEVRAAKAAWKAANPSMDKPQTSIL